MAATVPSTVEDLETPYLSPAAGIGRTVTIDNSSPMHTVTISLDMRAGTGGHYNVSGGVSGGYGPLSASLSWSTDYGWEHQFAKEKFVVLRAQQGSN